MNCCKCSRETKYSCILCRKPSCQVCSVQATENDEGYNEEEKCLGFCHKCKNQDDKSDNMDNDNLKITAIVQKARQYKQRSIDTLLKPASSEEPLSKKPRQEIIDKANKKNYDDVERKPRTVSVATIKKWIEGTLSQYDAAEWLTYDVKGDLACDMRCKVCTQFKGTISNMETFNKTWITGSTNYRSSNAKDHALGKPHKRAYHLYLNSKGLASPAQTQERGQTSIHTGVKSMMQRDIQRTKRKFQVAYFCAKEELATTKYSKILELEEIHSVDIGSAYRNRTQCCEFIDIIADDLSDKLQETITNVNFISVLWDGATDVSTLEKETMFVKYLNTSKENEVKVETRFLGLQTVAQADADGLVKSIDNGFKNLGIDNYKSKLVGLGADGASVNRGYRNGVQAKLKSEMPWLVYIWCLNHRLELAMKEALKGCYFEQVDEMLLRIYYLYEKSPKKLRELKAIYDLVRETYEFEENGISQIRASGTRWLAHKVNAISRIIDKFGVYITHIENVASDESNYQKEQQMKAKGYLKDWKTSKMLVNLCYYADLLSPLKKLSLILQREAVDTVAAADALLKAKREFNRLSTEDVKTFPHIAQLEKKVTTKEDGRQEYQGIVFSDLEQEIAAVSNKKADELQLVRSLLVEKLEENDSEYLDSISIVLNTESWSSFHELNEGFADSHITELYQQFHQPLKTAGLVSTEVEFIEQWHDLLSHTVKYLAPDSHPYHKTWKRIFKTSRSKQEFKDVLLLIELIFCLPVSASVCERSFSLLKRVKRDSRASLSENRIENLMRISIEGPPIQQFDVTSAVERWASQKPRRPRQKQTS